MCRRPSDAAGHDQSMTILHHHMSEIAQTRRLTATPPVGARIRIGARFIHIAFEQLTTPSGPLAGRWWIILRPITPFTGPGPNQRPIHAEVLPVDQT